MLVDKFLDIFPFWTFGIVIFTFLTIAGYAGQYLSHYLQKRGLIRNIEKKHQKAILAPILGLFALLIGFTFTMGLSRYELRRELVVHEANAIDTTYLRLQLLQEPYRSYLSSLLVSYMNTRVELFAPHSSPQEAYLQKQSEVLKLQFWNALTEALRLIPKDQITGQLLFASNQMFDVGSERIATQRAHIPTVVLEQLLWYAIIASALQGFLHGISLKHHDLIPAVLQLLVSMVIMLIVDLDYPHRGSITISQEPIKQVQVSLLGNERRKSILKLTK